MLLYYSVLFPCRARSAPLGGRYRFEGVVEKFGLIITCHMLSPIMTNCTRIYRPNLVIFNSGVVVNMLSVFYIFTHNVKWPII